MEETKELKVRFSTVICIILIILLIAGCGLLYYFGFVQKDKQLEKIEAEKTQVETKNAELEKQIIVIEKEVEAQKTDEKEKSETTNNIPTTDLVALYCDANDDHADLYYAYVKDGKLYYYQHFERADGKKETYYDFTTHFYLYEAEEEMKTYNGLDNIKRIKMYNSGTGVLPTIYLITDDGMVYCKSVDSAEFKLDERLKEYKVEDIINKTGEMADVFELLLKDGSTKTVEFEL